MIGRNSTSLEQYVAFNPLQSVLIELMVPLVLSTIQKLAAFSRVIGYLAPTEKTSEMVQENQDDEQFHEGAIAMAENEGDSDRAVNEGTSEKMDDQRAIGIGTTGRDGWMGWR